MHDRARTSWKRHSDKTWSEWEKEHRAVSLGAGSVRILIFDNDMRSADFRSSCSIQRVSRKRALRIPDMPPLAVAADFQR